MGEELTPSLVLAGYTFGVFPMAMDRDDPQVQFVEPETRGIIPLDAFHVPRRLRRQVRREAFDIRVDTAFAEVIDLCAAPTEARPETWINSAIRNAYLALAPSGHLHTVEAWDDDLLVGGLYGVAMGGVFFGESMFSRTDNASKIALVHLVARLRAGGFVLLDCQWRTDHLDQFGCVEIAQDRFKALLRDALRVHADFNRHRTTAAELDRVLRPRFPTA